MTGHVPGPYKVVDITRIEAAGYGLVAHVRGDLADPQTRQTAHMLAAAPKMLAEFKRIFADWPQLDTDEPINGGDMVDWFCQFAERARALIAKAERRSNG